jgi:hypothetical protein
MKRRFFFWAMSMRPPLMLPLRSPPFKGAVKVSVDVLWQRQREAGIISLLPVARTPVASA